MPNFKNFEKNLEGATRGQSFVWQVYGIFRQIWPPLVFGKLAVNSRCGYFTIGVFVCFKNNGERKTEIPLTNFETSSFIWKSFQLMQCTSQNSQNISVTVNKRSVYTLVFNYRYAKMYTWSIQSFQCRASSALAQWSLRTQAIVVWSIGPEWRVILITLVIAGPCLQQCNTMAILPLKGFVIFRYFKRPKTSFFGKKWLICMDNN